MRRSLETPQSRISRTSLLPAPASRSQRSLGGEHAAGAWRGLPAEIQADRGALLFPQGEAGLPGAPGFPGLRGEKGQQVSGGPSPVSSRSSPFWGPSLRHGWSGLGLGSISPGLWKRKGRGSGGSGPSAAARGQGLGNQSAKAGVIRRRGGEEGRPPCPVPDGGRPFPLPDGEP